MLCALLWVTSRVRNLQKDGRSQQKKRKTKKKTHRRTKRFEKSSFPTPENPQKNSTPLFGEVAKFRTLTNKEEQ